MNLKNMSKEELELLSYYDIAELLLKENNKPMNTPSLFKEICTLLGLSDTDYANKIGEFYTSLTTDKRFVMLDSNEWDLRDNHAIKITIDEDEEDEEETDYEEDLDEVESDIEDEIDPEEAIDDEELDVDVDDDLEDLSIMDEEDMTE